MKNYIFLHPLSEKGPKKLSIFNITFYKKHESLLQKIIVPALLGTLFLGACSDDASFEGEGKQQTYSLVVKGITTSGSDSSEELRDVSVFQFSDGNLYKTQQLTPESNGQSSISALSGSRLYFLTGVTLPVQEEGITEEEFRNMTIGEGLHNNSAPDFMAAIVELESTPQTRSNQEINVGMKRGVARIDLNTTADSKTLIKEIIVKDAPAETYPFIENASASDKTVSYLKNLIQLSVENNRESSAFSKANVLLISSCVVHTMKFPSVSRCNCQV